MRKKLKNLRELNSHQAAGQNQCKSIGEGWAKISNGTFGHI